MSAMAFLLASEMSRNRFVVSSRFASWTCASARLAGVRNILRVCPCDWFRRVLCPQNIPRRAV
eukprot:349398-Prorocentrum_minimum.AAC.1